MVLLIALLHGLPVLFVGWRFGSRLFVNAAAIVMSLVAVVTGGGAYAPLDLVAVWGAAAIVLRLLKTTGDSLSSERDAHLRAKLYEYFQDLCFILLWGSIVGCGLWATTRAAHAQVLWPACDSVLRVEGSERSLCAGRAADSAQPARYVSQR